MSGKVSGSFLYNIRYIQNVGNIIINRRILIPVSNDEGFQALSTFLSLCCATASSWPCISVCVRMRARAKIGYCGIDETCSALSSRYECCVCLKYFDNGTSVKKVMKQSMLEQWSESNTQCKDLDAL